MNDQEKQELVERYHNDSSITYCLTYEQLNFLLQEIGEMEPIVDAINYKNGASLETRARDIGCSPSDLQWQSTLQPWTYENDWGSTGF